MLEHTSTFSAASRDNAVPSPPPLVSAPSILSGRAEEVASADVYATIVSEGKFGVGCIYSFALCPQHHTNINLVRHVLSEGQATARPLDRNYSQQRSESLTSDLGCRPQSSRDSRQPRRGLQAGSALHASAVYGWPSDLHPACRAAASGVRSPP